MSHEQQSDEVKQFKGSNGMKKKEKERKRRTFLQLTFVFLDQELNLPIYLFSDVEQQQARNSFDIDRVKIKFDINNVEAVLGEFVTIAHQSLYHNDEHLQENYIVLSTSPNLFLHQQYINKVQDYLYERHHLEKTTGNSVCSYSLLLI